MHSVIFCFQHTALSVSCSYLNEVSGLCNCVSRPVLQQALKPLEAQLKINCTVFPAAAWQSCLVNCMACAVLWECFDGLQKETFVFYSCFFLFHDTWEFGGQNAAVFFQLWAVAHISFLVNPYFLSTKRMRVLQYTLACWSSYQTSGNTALPASVCRFRWLIILSDIAGWLMLRLVSLWSGPHSICTTVNKCCLSLAWKLQSPAWLLFTSPPAHLSIKHTKSCPLRVRLRCNMQELAN